MSYYKVKKKNSEIIKGATFSKPLVFFHSVPPQHEREEKNVISFNLVFLIIISSLFMASYNTFSSTIYTSFSLYFIFNIKVTQQRKLDYPISKSKQSQ